MDDGSTDGTGDLVHGLIKQRPAGEVKLVRVGRNQGKGASVRTGVQLARGEFILMVRRSVYMYISLCTFSTSVIYTYIKVIRLLLFTLNDCFYINRLMLTEPLNSQHLATCSS